MSDHYCCKRCGLRYDDCKCGPLEPTPPRPAGWTRGVAASTEQRETELRQASYSEGYRDGKKYASATLQSAPAQLESVVQVFGIIDPDYARVFTQARIIAWQHGYACLAHGSFTRDLDLLLVPWTDAALADDVDYFAPRIADAAGLKVSGPAPTAKPHGRKTWTLIFPGFADTRWVDLSVLAPPQAATPLPPQPLDKRVAELEAALSELVACKDLKDEELRRRQRRDYWSIRGNKDLRQEVDTMREDYNRRKPIAWANARAVLHTTQEKKA